MINILLFSFANVYGLSAIKLCKCASCTQNLECIDKHSCFILNILQNQFPMVSDGIKYGVFVTKTKSIHVSLCHLCVLVLCLSSKKTKKTRHGEPCEI